MAENFNDENLVNLIAQRLCREYPNYFSQYFAEFVEPLNIPSEIQNEAIKIFTNLYPTYNFDELVKAYRGFKVRCALNESPEIERPQSQICTSAIFDPQHRKYIRPNIQPPNKKRRLKEEYDPIKFLADQEKNFEGITLNFDMDLEEELAYLSFENDRKKNIVADNSIRKTVKLAAILNNACSYPILDFHGSQNIK